MIATLFTIFGIVAFILSGVGLYGVMSFSVNQRTQEFGIRMALGADARRILRMVMSQGAWQLAIGLDARRRRRRAAPRRGRAPRRSRTFSSRSTRSTRRSTSPSRGLLTLVAALSCFLPARRATRVDPMVALRYE